MNDNIKPKLIENNVKSFLNNALYNSFIYKSEWNKFSFNLFLFVSFFSSLLYFLIYRYNIKPTGYEKVLKEKMYYQKTLSEIKKYQLEHLNKNVGMITNLPTWNNEYTIIQQINNLYR